MIVVSNTGPLIALAKLDHLDILKQLVPDGVFIPPVIQHELYAKTGFESAALQIALDTFIQIQEPNNISPVVEIATSHLDEGEKQAIRLASSIKEDLFLLLDDNAGRKAARQLNRPITGTAGLLLKAKQKGLITEVLPLLNTLRDHGYWLSDALVEYICEVAKE